jgi:hypothetical protein
LAAGFFVFPPGRGGAGELLHVKIEGQNNPRLFAGTRGEIAVFDGDRRIGAMPLRIKVLP